MFVKNAALWMCFLILSIGAVHAQVELTYRVQLNEELPEPDSNWSLEQIDMRESMIQTIQDWTCTIKLWKNREDFVLSNNGSASDNFYASSLLRGFSTTIFATADEVYSYMPYYSESDGPVLVLRDKTLSSWKPTGKTKTIEGRTCYEFEAESRSAIATDDQSSSVIRCWVDVDSKINMTSLPWKGLPGLPIRIYTLDTPLLMLTLCDIGKVNTSPTPLPKVQTVLLSDLERRGESIRKRLSRDN